MRRRHIHLTAVLLLALTAWLSPPATQADTTFDVTLDVTGLRDNPYGAGAPYSVDFLVTGDQGNNDSVTISSFAITAASLGASAAPSGDVSGSLSTVLVVGDTSFVNDYNQVITPDNSSNPIKITFQMAATTNFASGSFPDNFAFSILDGSGSPIPTTDSFGGSLFNFNLEPGLDVSQIAVYQSTNSPVLGPPVIVPLSTVPEPATLILLAIAVPLVIGATTASRTVVGDAHSHQRGKRSIRTADTGR